MIVSYGTSDDFLNFGEIALLLMAKKYLGADQVWFFTYPKPRIWDRYEESLFRPYQAFPSDPRVPVSLAGIKTSIKFRRMM